MNSKKFRDDFMTPVLEDGFAHMSPMKLDRRIIDYLAQNPNTKKKLVDEIRGRFTTPDQINLAAKKELPYLTACINEDFRLCNPISARLPRCVPPPVYRAAYRPPERPSTNFIAHPTVIALNPSNFHRAAEFLPERWLPSLHDPQRSANDALDSLFPFGTGPRTCPEKTLA
ncbi:cytochrome P450 [Lentithecium fluviatile CBS 122367]|uniref:Cytochrome P450 n=1 Tax=Lentithecium fluviatile CBS 122367 TaxID=1168545 RepID=A0A6G1IHW7_9PLEO|nr:cytochrome P450 [Lentithecium fluviatile CBS 122367]